MAIETISCNKIFDGYQYKFRHTSIILNCKMNFSIYIPETLSQRKIPLIYWLSGLTCTDDNFVQKAGAQKFAAKKGIAIVCPDTSPRGDNIPNDPNKSYDLGHGAGFYLNATEKPWSDNYRMYDYVVKELPEVINKSNHNLDIGNCSIMGHSMGGHGAITIALKNADTFKSVSAFSPICSPLNCPWGQKAFQHYLGSDRGSWNKYDSCYLISNASKKIPILIDQGSNDEYLLSQLKPNLLQKACNNANYPLTIRFHEGYDHSYFFISSFIEDHMNYHALALQ